MLVIPKNNLRRENKQLKSKISLLEKELKQANEVARIDPLTKIDNRRGLDIEIGKLVDQIERDEILERTCILLMLDLNDFKKVNDTLGHAVGDEYLKDTAEFLKENFRPYDTISRIRKENKNGTVSRVGGDEFVVLLTSKEDISEKIQKRLQKSLQSQKYKHLNISVGILSFSIKDLLESTAKENIKKKLVEVIERDLDKKLYEAKELAKKKGKEGSKVPVILTERIKFEES